MFLLTIGGFTNAGGKFLSSGLLCGCGCCIVGNGPLVVGGTVNGVGDMF